MLASLELTRMRSYAQPRLYVGAGLGLHVSTEAWPAQRRRGPGLEEYPGCATPPSSWDLTLAYRPRAIFRLSASLGPTRSGSESCRAAWNPVGQCELCTAQTLRHPSRSWFCPKACHGPLLARLFLCSSAGGITACPSCGATRIEAHGHRLGTVLKRLAALGLGGVRAALSV